MQQVTDIYGCFLRFCWIRMFSHVWFLVVSIFFRVSSFNCGVMMEHSPVTQPLHDAGYCCLKPTPQLSFNEHAWTRATTMLYVEHPIGTSRRKWLRFVRRSNVVAISWCSSLFSLSTALNFLLRHGIFVWTSVPTNGAGGVVGSGCILAELLQCLSAPQNESLLRLWRVLRRYVCPQCHPIHSLGQQTRCA